MRPVVRYFMSPDVDLDDFQPEDPECFSFLLQVIVGPRDSEGEESVMMTVCTPRGLEDRVRQSGGVLFGRSLLIVDTPDVQVIKKAVTRAIERIDCPTWREIAYRLSRLGIHEFEDHLG
ncbi:hypothetical protein GCM10009839_49640 [Catenulispora yoronensis]|uniref:Immunity protein 8 n=1 Tax=Catenulispora yoronensis TaxID=450799 RepID=A0ABP5G6W4_9ACTN